MIRIVFLDFDGTLYSHQTLSFPRSALNALKKLKENGILSFLCSGRALVELDQFDMSEIEVDGMILSNGLVAFDSKGNKIYEKVIDGQLKETLLRYFNEKRFPIYFSTPHKVILNYCDEIVKHVQDAVSSEVPPVGEYCDEPIYMASTFFKGEDMPKEILDLKDIAEVTIWHQGALDVVPKGMSKVSGIEAVCDHYGITREETICFGDGDNDIAMLKHCGIGVAMGNSPDFVKEAADYVTDDIDEDGLYNGLIHFGLIKEDQ